MICRGRFVIPAEWHRQEMLQPEMERTIAYLCNNEMVVQYIN